MKTSKEHEAFRKEVCRIIEKWRRLLFLNAWTFNVTWPDADCTHSEHGQTIDKIASSDIDPIYLRSEIRIYPLWKTRDKEDREKDIVHEMAHCLTETITRELELVVGGQATSNRRIKEINENMTEHIASIIFQLR